jgi:hypothetical protein
VDVPEPPEILVGLNEHVSPAGDCMALRVTAPVNPLTGVTVIADVPVAPAKIVRLLGLVVTVKSVTVNVTVAA